MLVSYTYIHTSYVLGILFCFFVLWAILHSNSQLEVQCLLLSRLTFNFNFYRVFNELLDKFSQLLYILSKFINVRQWGCSDKNKSSCLLIIVYTAFWMLLLACTWLIWSTKYFNLLQLHLQWHNIKFMCVHTKSQRLRVVNM